MRARPGPGRGFTVWLLPLLPLHCAAALAATSGRAGAADPSAPPLVVRDLTAAHDADLLEFPGMDHLYLRLAWAYLEPAEGKFDWAVLDRIITKWTAQGLGIAFRISCKETSTDRVEQQYATPRWVKEAGAQGGYYRAGQAVGPEGPWEPRFDDPVFLAKLDRFLAAFAARYAAQPWVRYVDIGSIGDWGEGHTWAGSRQVLSLAVRKQHVDLHRKHFKRAWVGPVGHRRLRIGHAVRRKVGAVGLLFRRNAKQSRHALEQTAVGPAA